MEDESRIIIFKDPVKELLITNALNEKSSFNIFKAQDLCEDRTIYLSRARIKPFVYIEMAGETVDFVEEQTLLYLRTMGWCLM